MQILKVLLISLLTLLAAVTVTIGLYIKFDPQFGSAPSDEQILEYELTGHYENGKFLNLQPFELNLDCHSIVAMLKKAINPPDGLRPQNNIDVEMLDLDGERESRDQITWLGHSSFLIQLDGKNILIDPIFTNYAAPHPWLGTERFSEKMPVAIEELPFIDYVVISHDHYDHLDYPTIKKLMSKTGKFLTPLGVGNHLRAWGVKAESIVELDWWEEVKFDDQLFVLTPSQHMSGRRLNDQSSTLWGSWVLKGKISNIYFSGDGGYGDHFSSIGEKYGPFDIALMESGQYDELWPNVHLMPEQTVQAGVEVGAKLIMPIHWGAFVLANHTWTDPVVRVTKEAEKQGIDVTTPKIGESVSLPISNFPRSRWWEQYL